MSDRTPILAHGIVCAMPDDPFGYFGWPSIARQDDGTLIVASSGRRRSHVCPWGKTVLCQSRDEGATWSPPQVVNDSPIDDRDAGIISLGGQRLALTWFTSKTSHYIKPDPVTGWAPEHREMAAIFAEWTPAMLRQHIGSWVRVSPDGAYWGEPRPVPVSSPHGFIVLPDHSWLYLGKSWEIDPVHIMTRSGSPIRAVRSSDEGRTWELLGEVPLPAGLSYSDMHEPHVVLLDDGTLLGAIRAHQPLRTLFSRSSDGGRTWTPMEDPQVFGTPPHLLKHSSGAIVMVYGYRNQPFGERAMVSHDGGRSWQRDIVLRDDGPTHDLGYPASVELSNSEILTVYYQQLQAGQPCSLLWTRWRLPE